MSLPMSKTAPYAIVGCILSMYALYVEHKVAHKSPDEEFSALCDIEQLNASCRWGACGFDLLWLGLASLSSCLWLCTKTKRRIRVRGGTGTPNKTNVLSIDLISLSISHLIFHFNTPLLHCVYSYIFRQQCIPTTRGSDADLFWNCSGGQFLGSSQCSIRYAPRILFFLLFFAFWSESYGADF